ncbi:tetratricopeptide repeat protein [Culicoidibacter larvae]|uniref:tetratricopeptide repeat protein n=1 Tax=Culicoidibacter larvae TaxID=2579976 RepID=UPI0014856A24|nr:tetratricopeptide repeat protein [Culicoidibacter larvae]
MSFELQQVFDEAKALVDEQRFDEAYRLLEAALADFDNDTLILLWLARLGVLGAGRAEETVEYATRVLAEDDRSADAFTYRGWAYYELEVYDLALNDFNYAVSLSNHQDAYAIGGRGITYYQLDDYGRAKEDLLDALQMNPEWLLGLAICGWVLYELNEYDAAIENFNKAIEMEPRYGYAYGGRGLCFHEKQEYDLAIEDLTLALEENPKWPLGFAVRGWAYYHIEYYFNQFELALADFNSALELSDNTYSFATSGRGLVLYQMNRYEDALQDLNTAIAASPMWTVGLATRGYVHYELNDYQTAFTDFDLALTLSDNDYPYAQGGRGLIAYHLEDYPLAIADLTTVLNDDSKWLGGWSSLAFSYLYSDQLEEALPIFNKAIQVAGSMVPDSLYFGRGNVYFMQDNFGAAIADFTQFLANNPNDNLILQQRAYAYSELNMIKKAIIDVERLVNTLHDAEQLDFLVSLYERIPSKYSDKIIPLYQQAVAQTNSSFAMMRLGCIYLTGLYSSAIDYPQALTLLSDANATHGGDYSCALVHIGFAYEHGLGVAVDNNMAFAYYQKAAEFESYCPCASAQMIHSYYKGIGVEKNITQAFELLNNAIDANKDHENIDYLHAYFLVHGIGFYEDKQKAEQIIDKLLKEEPEAALNHYYKHVLSGINNIATIQKLLPYTDNITRAKINSALSSNTIDFFYPF